MSIKLTIPEPCHENWQNMEPDKDGRHCLSCRKTVVDFSVMTDKEILDYVSHAGDNICGRFDPHQLNRGLREYRTRKRFSWVYAWGLAAVSFFWSAKAKAQGGVRFEKVAQLSDDRSIVLGKMVWPRENEPKATVIDELTGLPVPFASVLSKKGRSAIADSSGKFNLGPFMGARQQLTISAIGYAAQTIKLDKHNKNAITIYLQPEAKELPAVEITSKVICTLRRETMGSVSMIAGELIPAIEVSATEKMTRVVREWFPKKDVVAYPNPVSPGSEMKVDLKLKETGQYRVELIDAAGKIVWIRSMPIPSRQFNISVPTQPTWSAGVYWLRISGTHTKNIYNSRVVIQ